MTVVSSPLDFNAEQLFVDLKATFGRRLYLKCEGFNFAGSIKMKAALGMVEAAERSGVLRPGSVLVESSSGNLGTALAMIAANRGYGFVCVTDTRCNAASLRAMEAFGAQVHVVRRPDPLGGYLGARINYVQALCVADERYVWLNQYANPNNWGAHMRTTAPAIAREFPELDVLFVGAGTTGTLMGCARYFRQRNEQGHRPVRVVAVDAVGSVTFGGAPAPRMIPGLGTSVRPEQLDESFVDEVVFVEEVDTVRACRRMAGNGFLFGGSTGTVVSGAMSWLAEHDTPGLTAVAISPDLGERYLDTVYHDGWVADAFGSVSDRTGDLTLPRPGGVIMASTFVDHDDRTIDQSSTEAVRVIKRAALDRELSAAHAAVAHLRAELAGLLAQVQQTDKDPDATTVVPQRAAVPAPPRPVVPPRPAPLQAPARPLPQAPRPAIAARPVPAPPARPQRPAPQPAPVRAAGRPPQPTIARPVPVAAPAPAPAPAATPEPASPDGLEAGYAAVLAEVLGVADVPATSNFFDDLGADSMVMARFCAKVRTRPDLPNVAIKDIYRAPTVAELAAAGAKKPVPPTSQGPGTPSGRLTPVRSDLDPATVQIRLVEPSGPGSPPAPVGTLGYLLCGLLQLLFLLGYPALLSYAFAVGAEWVLTATTPLEIYGRSAGLAGGLFLGTALLPIAAKWLLVGRWKPTQFPVWSLPYYRFWLVKTLIRTNPLVRFVGTPLYPLYLRMLGAKIGKGATILSPTVPVCTDLLTIGADTIVRKASSFTCYRADAGQIWTGPVTIGANALVGEATVLDIGTSIGDWAQLGHTSSLHSGQSVPNGQRWHGSPAEPTSTDYRAVPAAGGGALRRFTYTAVQLVVLFGITMPLGLTALALLVREVPLVQALLLDIENAAADVPLHLDVLILSSTVFVGGLLLGLLVMTTVPRVLALLVRPDRVYRTYGIAYWALRTITRMTNSTFYTRVFGDSSYIVGYLRAIGYRFGRVEQTGSNFGTAVAHDNPFLCQIGGGTVVADGLTMLNADYSSSAFTASPVRIGAHSFLGNAIFYPARARVGGNCLLATKVMVPIDGPLRQGVGLLGSPSFVIPRSVDRDDRLALRPEDRRRGVAAKARHNLLSIVLLLLSRWVLLTLVVALARIALDLHAQYGAPVIAALGAAELVLTFAYFMLLDASVRRLAARRPEGVSIYDRTFWRHERYWKVAADTYFQVLNGTPLKSGLWRALGVRVGRRLYDDGCMLTERSFVILGDNVMLNERSVVQCHSQENDAFKSDHVTIGSDVTVGVGAFIHYGTRLGNGSTLEADSFLMKGEEIAPRTRWGGNPATELGTEPSRRTT